MNTDNRHRFEHSTQEGYQLLMHAENDEINFSELFFILLRRWKIILGVLVACVAVALGVAFTSSPVYKATSHLLLPFQKDTQSFSQISGAAISPGGIYSDFTRNANSLRVQKAFFELENLGVFFSEEKDLTIKTESEKNALFQAFIGLLDVYQDKKNSDLLSVSLEWKSAEGAADLVNKYVAFVEAETLSQAKVNFENARTNQLTSIKNDMEAKRNTEKDKRLRRIAHLKEALAIAKSLNIVNPLDSRSNGQPVTQGILVEMSSGPQYYRGSRALEAEIHALEIRTNDDAFIASLGGLQEKVARLALITLNVETIHAIRVDSPAIAPLNRLKPKRALIVILGGLLGGMLGILAAFMAEFISIQKQKMHKVQSDESTKSTIIGSMLKEQELEHKDGMDDASAESIAGSAR